MVNVNLKVFEFESRSCGTHLELRVSSCYKKFLQGEDLPVLSGQLLTFSARAEESSSKSRRFEVLLTV